MSLTKEEIAALKKSILPEDEYEKFSAAFDRLKSELAKEFKVIEEHGNRVIPEVQFSETKDGTLPEYILVSDCFKDKEPLPQGCSKLLRNVDN